MERRNYHQGEVQMIVDKYDHSISMSKNAKIFANLLDRKPDAVLNKLANLKRKGTLVISEKIVQDVTPESFMSVVLNLALARIDKDEKQKLIIKLMSEI